MTRIQQSYTVQPFVPPAWVQNYSTTCRARAEERSDGNYTPNSRNSAQNVFTTMDGFKRIVPENNDRLQQNVEHGSLLVTNTVSNVLSFLERFFNSIYAPMYV
jgi:hypothetical protein